MYAVGRLVDQVGSNLHYYVTFISFGETLFPMLTVGDAAASLLARSLARSAVAVSLTRCDPSRFLSHCPRLAFEYVGGGGLPRL